MYTLLTNRRDDKDRDGGFTLIELMVVVLIIAILLAIAIPTFLGAQTKAKDRGAQSTARNSLTSAKTIYADKGDYTDATFTNLLLLEPSITFVVGTAASTDPKTVSVNPSAKVWTAAVLSKSGTCYYVRDSIDPADATAKGTSYFKDDSATAAAGCKGNAAVAYTTTGWD